MRRTDGVTPADCTTHRNLGRGRVPRERVARDGIDHGAFGATAADAGECAKAKVAGGATEWQRDARPIGRIRSAASRDGLYAKAAAHLEASRRWRPRYGAG